MIDKQKQKLNMKVQWAKFAVVLALYLLFLIWVESWLGLIVVPFIFDVYITKKIHWQWWKDEEGPVRFIMSWVDALVFALALRLRAVCTPQLLPWPYCQRQTSLR